MNEAREAFQVAVEAHMASCGWEGAKWSNPADVDADIGTFTKGAMVAHVVASGRELKMLMTDCEKCGLHVSPSRVQALALARVSVALQGR